MFKAIFEDEDEEEERPKNEVIELVESEEEPEMNQPEPKATSIIPSTISDRNIKDVRRYLEPTKEEEETNRKDDDSENKRIIKKYGEYLFMDGKIKGLNYTWSRKGKASILRDTLFTLVDVSRDSSEYGALKAMLFSSLSIEIDKGALDLICLPVDCLIINISNIFII